ncbi:hypothetical protein METP2_03233 [Methanosarcinales archaeon]|nr:hypothetical protein METP2_03233 [Methanosarcinales archaeon]
MSNKSTISKEFFENEVNRRKKAIEDLKNDLSFSIISGSYKDRAILTNIKMRLIKENKS